MCRDCNDDNKVVVFDTRDPFYGGCNYCQRVVWGGKIFVVRGSDPGTTEVRFCTRCLNQLIAGVNWIKKQRAPRRTNARKKRRSVNRRTR